jgi:hypothetical protein
LRLPTWCGREHGDGRARSHIVGSPADASRDGVLRSVEQPLERALVLLVAGVVVMLQVTLDILDCALQDVETITQRLQLLARDDEFVLTETEFRRAAARFVVALPARVTAVQPGPARP